MNERIFNRILAGRVASGKWQKYMSISRAERVAKSDVSDKFVTGRSEAETGEELRPHGTSATTEEIHYLKSPFRVDF